VRHDNAKTVLVAITQAAPQTPLLTNTRRLRLRMRGFMLVTRAASPLDYSILSSLLLPKAVSTKRALYQRRPVLQAPRRVSPFFAPNLIYIGGRAGPIKASLRLLFLLASTPTAPSLSPTKIGRYWHIAPLGSLLKTPFSFL
jgi:hypothetical protein